MAIKALSIQQPWAWLILHGGKDIENRVWKTNFRGEVFIHAGKKIDKDAIERLSKTGVELPEKFETGGIIGTVEIVDCVVASESEWFDGPFGFKLKNAKPCQFRACPGKLNFFVPEGI